MAKIRLIFLFTLLLCKCSDIIGQDNNQLRILLIGNSFSQNATRYLPEIAKHHKIEFGHAEAGGCSLQRHWDSAAVTLKDRSKGILYNNKSLLDFLEDGKWDIITLQQYSLLSGDTATYEPYFKRLYQLIKKYQPSARLLIQQTWPYRSDAQSFGKIDGEKRAQSQKEMWEMSRSAYFSLGKKYGIQIIPSGDAFYTVATTPEWAFIKDYQFDSSASKPTELPIQKNSLNVGYTLSKDGQLKFDPNHANEAGCYLAGLIWYSILLNEDARRVTFKPNPVSKDFARFLRETAYQTVENVKVN